MFSAMICAAMNENLNLRIRARRLMSPALLLCAALGCGPAASGAENMFQPRVQPGGIDCRPTITGLRKTGTNSVLEWYGLRGGYHVQGATAPASAWSEITNALAGTFSNSIVMGAMSAGQKFFRLQTDNSFVGSGACSSCHWDRYNDWQGTMHARAWDGIAALPAPVQKDCIACHTTGSGQPTGFATYDKTPNLANVGCENCHGPGAAHKYGDHSIVRPAVTIAAETCGGCHDGSHNPTYTEWTNTAHASVTEDVASGFSDTPSGQSRMTSCGACHSGATRMAMLQQYESISEGYPSPLELPTAHDAATYGVTCAICHDPHAKNLEHQLRNPLFSTNNFSLRSSSTFAEQYNPAIQICGQCHNDRGASWTSTSRPPHHSPQYNFLLGTIGEQQSGQPLADPGSHALLITNQCIGCHMPSTPYTNEQQPAVTGHRFKVESFDICTKCHALPGDLVTFTTNAVWSQIQEVKTALDLWATTKAPPALQGYGTRAWEYTSPGTLSSGGPGPTSSEQAFIPVNIQKARYNMYVVFHDGSYGVHNARLAAVLLDNALSWVQQEMAR